MKAVELLSQGEPAKLAFTDIRAEPIPARINSQPTLSNVSKASVAINSQSMSMPRPGASAALTQPSRSKTNGLYVA